MFIALNTFSKIGCFFTFEIIVDHAFPSQPYVLKNFNEFKITFKIKLFHKEMFNTDFLIQR